VSFEVGSHQSYLRYCCMHPADDADGPHWNDDIVKNADQCLVHCVSFACRSGRGSLCSDLVLKESR